MHGEMPFLFLFAFRRSFSDSTWHLGFPASTIFHSLWIQYEYISSVSVVIFKIYIFSFQWMQIINTKSLKWLLVTVVTFCGLKDFSFTTRVSQRNSTILFLFFSFTLEISIVNVYGWKLKKQPAYEKMTLDFVDTFVL